MSTVHDSDESLFHPGRRDLSFYAILCCLVLPIWSIVPLSWAYTIYAFLNFDLLNVSLYKRILLGFTLCEVLFSICHFYFAHRISPPAPNPPSDVAEFQLALKRSLKSGLASLPPDGGDEESVDFVNPGSPAESVERLSFYDPRAVEFRSSFRTWFGKAPISQIRYEHVETWLYFLAFNTVLPLSRAMSKSHRAIIEDTISLIEKRSGMLFPKADKSELANPKVTPLLLTIDPLNVVSRPFVWYLAVKLANIAIMKWHEIFHGLRYGRFRSLEYLIYTPPNYCREMGPDPVVFLHGLGIGVVQHAMVLHQFLKEAPHTPLLIPLQPHISQDIFHPRYFHPMNRREKVSRLVELLTHLGWVGPTEQGTNGVTVLSHSNGTFVHSWLLKTYPEFVKRSCFMDPVTFCLWEGDVCYNFVYRKCTTGVELVVRYFAGMELGIANLIQRHFDWMSNTLWFEEIPEARDAKRTVYLLSGNDCILSAERIKRYLTSHGVKEGIWYYPDSIHGEAIMRPSRGLKQFFDWLNDVPAKENSISSVSLSSVIAHDRNKDKPTEMPHS